MSDCELSWRVDYSRAEREKYTEHQGKEIVDLIGRTAVITGATKGIGRAIAEALVRAGVNVSICGRHEDELH